MKLVERVVDHITTDQYGAYWAGVRYAAVTISALVFLATLRFSGFAPWSAHSDTAFFLMAIPAIAAAVKFVSGCFWDWFTKEMKEGG